jgi:cytoskeletal protein CcmA (bactofilin family)
MGLFSRQTPGKVLGSDTSGHPESTGYKSEPAQTELPALARAPKTPVRTPGAESVPPTQAASGKENRMVPPQTPKNTLLEPAPIRSASSAGSSSGLGSSRSMPNTYISQETVIEGKIMAQNEVVIDGSFKGDIISNTQVVVGKNGRLEGSVEAKAMMVCGQVVGNLHILERLEIQSTGEVYGDLETQPGALIIEKGARLEGHCIMGSNGPTKRPPQSVGPAPRLARSEPEDHPV